MNLLRRLFSKSLGKAAGETLPAGVPEDRVAGMLTNEERVWLRNYAATEYSGAGAIVELGCFVGSGSIALAEGLLDSRRHPNAKVHAYDRFVWDKFLQAWWIERGFPPPRINGDSLLPEFLERTARWKHWLVVHEQDLNAAQWDETPIEFLFIDAMKSPRLAEAITQAFFPYLIPGLSFVAHQDFAHFFTSWIHLLQFRLRDCFEALGATPGSSTVLFRCLKVPGNEQLHRLSLNNATHGEIEAAFDYSLGVVSEHQKRNVMAAKAMAYIHRGDLARAGEVLAAIGAAGIEGGEVESVRQILEERLG
jgi:hypothetical protein